MQESLKRIKCKKAKLYCFYDSIDNKNHNSDCQLSFVLGVCGIKCQRFIAV